MSAAAPHLHPVDEILPPQRLMLLGLQHVLVMAASPITAVFLIGKTLHLGSDITVNLISATFLMCGLGSLLQSFARSNSARVCRSSWCRAAPRS